MRIPRFSSLLLGIALVALTCAAREIKPPQVADVTAADGVKLKVSYFAAEKPGPGVLLLHQCNRQRRIWDGLALELEAAGINVLTLDLRGFGQSEGDPVDKLTPQQAQAARDKWPSDIDVAFQYLKSQPGVKQDAIGVGGASCGVNNSIQTALRHAEVKSLVLLSGNTDYNGRQFLRKGTLPVFLAAADDDEFPQSIVAIEWFYRLDPNPGKRFEHYAFGGHGADMFPFHPELPKMIVDWYVTTLIKTPGRAPATQNKAAIPDDIQTLDMIDQPGGTEKVAQMLTTRRRGAKAKLFDEATVNIMGYEHIQAGDTKGAVEIMKLNTTAYPDSPNVYDSLADAYLADGQRDLARQNAQKALDGLASDTTDPPARRDLIRASAEQKLKQLAQ